MNNYIIIFLILLIIYLIYKNNKYDHFENQFSNLKDVSIYVINLKKDVERKEIIEKSLKEQNINYEITEAVNGSELDMNKLKEEKTIPDNITLRKGEIGCYLSHYNLWKKFINTDKKYCLILEDDATFCDDFNIKLNHMIGELNNFKDNIDVIYLTDISHCMPFMGEDCKITEGTYNMTNIYYPKNLGYGTSGYIITRHGAEKLINYAIPISMPIDVLLHNLNYDKKIIVLKTTKSYIEPKSTFSNTQ